VRMSPETLEIVAEILSDTELPTKAELARLPEARRHEILREVHAAVEYAEIEVFLERRKRESETQDLRRFAGRNDDDGALREYEQRRRARDEEGRQSHV